MLASIKMVQPFLHTTEILLLIEKDIIPAAVIHNLEMGGNEGKKKNQEAQKFE